MFYCREQELAKLNRRYADDQFECVVIYGRRRVGKTAIIKEFCKDKPAIFFSALNATAQENLESLSSAIFEYLHPDLAGNDAPVYPSFDAALQEITRLAESQRLIFVIDEYPYLAKANKSFSSRLQHIIDHTWQNSKLFLILCGSSMSFMEKQVLGYESPLYGRRTAQFKLEALHYREIKAFHPNLSPEQLSLIYGITGGIPHYINKLGVRSDIDAALLENFFEPSAYLFEEPENLLKQELREPAMYNSIIAAIAGGASHINEITTKVGIESGKCMKYLTVLLELGILQKETPLTEKPGRKTIYTIKDQFFRFWYRFVPRNMTAISSGRIANVYDRAVKAHLHGHMGLAFEEMCKEYLLYYADNLPIELSDIGQWWGSDKETHKEVQIDIVGCQTDSKEYLIGSCKYRNEKIGTDELELLRHYAAVFGKGSKYHYYIFSLGGFTAPLLECGKRGEVTLITLDAMY
ncbi:MAG: ATP-binding protein [Oscillospiraceae bacterium]|nr:ATP-binding protein [Oscillospiraceae bacterium]